MYPAAGASGTPIRKNMSQDVKRAMIDWPLERSKNRAITHRELVIFAEQSGTKRASISILWKFYRRQKRDEGIQNMTCHAATSFESVVRMMIYLVALFSILKKVYPRQFGT